MAEENVRAAPPTNWRKLGPGTAIPIVLLVGLLFLIANLHEGIATGFTAPRFVSDARGGIVFYDEGSREMSFAFRRSEDGVGFGPPTRSRGILASAALCGDSLVTLFANPKDKDGWFYSLYDRKSLERRWSGGFSERDLGLTHPGHVAVVDSQVFVFGVDAKGALRAAHVNEDGALVPVAARLAGAWDGEDPDARRESLKRLPHAYTSAPTADGLLLAWRVGTGEDPRPSGPGQVRYARFDGERFGPVETLDVDLAAPALVRRDDGAVWLFGVPREGESGVELFALGDLGFSRLDSLPAPEGRFQARAQISSLSAGELAGKLLLFGQVGASIRYRVHTDAGWDDGWQDLAQLPAEQQALIFGWFGALLGLALVLVVRGVLGLLRLRRTPPPGSPPATGEPPPSAPLPERALAFSLDLGLLAGLGWAALALVPGLDARAQAAPLAYAAFFTLGGLGYFTLCELVWAKTFGKACVGLEVQDLAGGRAPWNAVLYRNLFRIELLIPPPHLLGALALLILVCSRHRQRPGDWVACTTVRVA
ncbi:MAG: RDD family protein [Planctomycetota bacterium]